MYMHVVTKIHQEIHWEIHSGCRVLAGRRLYGLTYGPMYGPILRIYSVYGPKFIYSAHFSISQLPSLPLYPQLDRSTSYVNYARL